MPNVPTQVGGSGDCRYNKNYSFSTRKKRARKDNTMFRPSTVSLAFKANVRCDVTKNGSKVRVSAIPNPVTSYTKLPASLRSSLGLVDPEVEKTEKDARRKLVGELLRMGGSASKSAASTIMEKLRSQQTGKNTDLFGPVSLELIARDGEVRRVETFVSFGSEKEELSPLGKTAQLGLRDLEQFGAVFDFTSWDMTFAQRTAEAESTTEAAPTEDTKEADAGVDLTADEEEEEDLRRKVDPSSRRLAGSMIPGKHNEYGIAEPETNPEGPLKYGL